MVNFVRKYCFLLKPTYLKMETTEKTLKRPLESLAKETRKPKKARKIDTRELRAKRPGFDKNKYLETSYYFENGLRKVHPYNFMYTSFAKARWVGEKLIEVFAKEFRALSRDTYERRILNGKTTVNFEKVESNYIVQENDLIGNTVHRHEVPVSAEKIEILHKDDEVLVINKPSSIPVHPCGRYRHNSILFILAKEYKLQNLRTIHRLDRLTSGVLILGRSLEKARRMEKQIANREVNKVYLCRVKGEFPNESVEVDRPIKTLSFKIGLCKVSEDGKPCKTMFTRLSYNGRTSVVQCKPFQGRMHQIRVHLQYLGYPILNDNLYNHPAFGPERGKNGNYGKSDDELIEDLIQAHNMENWLTDTMPSDDIAFASKTSKKETKFTASTIKGTSAVASTDETRSDIPFTVQMNTSTKEPCAVASAEVSSAASVSDSSPNGEATVFGSSSNLAERSGSTELESSGNEKDEKKESASEQPDGHRGINTNQCQTGERTSKEEIDTDCRECRLLLKDPSTLDLVMYLHAYHYKGPDWEFSAPYPEWAKEDWVEPEELMKKEER